MRSIGINFHEGLQLSRSRLATTLRFYSANPDSTKEMLRDGTELGANMVVAFPNLAVGCGFLEEGISKGSKHLTLLGMAVLENDPFLDTLASEWLIHFGLSKPMGRGPTFWKSIILELTQVGSNYSMSLLAEQLSHREAVVPAKVNLGVSKLIEAYSNPDFLGRLGLFSKYDGECRALAPTHELSPSVFNFAVAQRWDDLHPDQLTTSLDTFVRDSKLVEIFRISQDQIIGLLEQMAHKGHIELYRSAPPHQLVRRWESVRDLLGQLYESQ